MKPITLTNKQTLQLIKNELCDALDSADVLESLIKRNKKEDQKQTKLEIQEKMRLVNSLLGSID